MVSLAREAQLRKKVAPFKTKILKKKEAPNHEDVKYAVIEINRTLGLQPPITANGGKERMIQELMLLQDTYDENDNKLMSPHTNWTLMKLGVSPWSHMNFKNPFDDLSKVEKKLALLRIKEKVSGEKTPPYLLPLYPLNMLVFNPFTDKPCGSTNVIYQYMSDPSQTTAEITRKMRAQGMVANMTAVANVVTDCKKVLRYLHLYQGYTYGLHNLRKDRTEEEITKKSQELFSPFPRINDGGRTEECVRYLETKYSRKEIIQMLYRKGEYNFRKGKRKKDE